MKPTFDATGEVLVVTGGARGIGAAVARAYTGAGGTAVVLDLLEPEQSGPGLHHLTVDVTDRAEVIDAMSLVQREFGRIDGLIAGAAVQPRADVVDTPEALWRQAIEVNLNGVVWSCQAVLPAMLAAGRGSIVLFASGLATFGRAQAAAYAATKGAMIPFAKSLAAEVAHRRVRVNVIFPGVIDTPQFQAANPTGPEREHWARTTGIGEPEDVVGPLLFLLSEAATMSGSVLTRDRAFAGTAR
ncbi:MULTISPECIES: SDR family NAD(P)-dependent oxidoreductase [unclassified Crossiella]|uniref:SDR family NAD(P)-dependent oxidoreductase n=1 Tax=unclassified Crossiella TaxID=2620835 RepID=UPI001FFE5266|nr:MULTISPECIES: SDR family oxidoreductase [unclassified Crossiella]MCK2244667.1 SDR family oxidoreductase [Crossiella sp. S99.2]MCK2258346.1 SDR family oxidoreductase [Crossiella sp. S99.1]